ncbi:hypothetical protein A3G06_01910 [Candidatus Nomurabacteria bacterium RIFCSPLOWO2_12_FULL_46_14]|uniref:Mannosyl-glycoprotein endo-beta-N-acetylglucosamidase-like domain-containing protein n=1 Tax=Candidatus Nomurabacteria bacterium RIFCSPLOWO2_12_FULL_46_14 TaxID=1801797 RepID=A0A1F6YAF2_9BACT|nr:MAG: hypothetical protein A3G06_01910 [Candidatus Nomurabacteria bacterium RIFCSPLOWO2_12_FULL_46_14]
MSIPATNIPARNMPVVRPGIVMASRTASQKLNIGEGKLLSFNPTVEPIDLAALKKAEEQKVKAAAIDEYFRTRKMPLEGQGLKMVLEAEKNDLDWRLLAAIAVRESTGGKYACRKAENNPFGWGSCRIGFETMEEAIEVVAKNLGGNNPKTERHYADKETKEILRAYNPPSIVPRYAEEVLNIMNVMGPLEYITEVATL